jgi:hypothetical protein
VTDILIRNVPDSVAEKLSAAAKNHGRTVEAEALELVCQGVTRPFTADERLERSRFYLRQSGGPYEPLIKEQIREGAD